MRRERFREGGVALRRKLGVEGSNLARATGLEELLDEMIFAGVWGRDGLDHQDRMVCTLAAVTLAGREREISKWTRAALEIGLDGGEIIEVFIQCGLYGGFGATETAFVAAEPIFESSGVDPARESPSEETLEELDGSAFALAAELHGSRSTSDYADPADPVTAVAYAIARRWGYGVIWRRPGLSFRRRILCALASFAALGITGSLTRFAAAAREQGLSEEEVREAILQACAYAGLPRSFGALRAASGPPRTGA